MSSEQWRGRSSRGESLDRCGVVCGEGRLDRPSGRYLIGASAMLLRGRPPARRRSSPPPRQAEGAQRAAVGQKLIWRADQTGRKDRLGEARMPALVRATSLLRLAGAWVAAQSRGMARKALVFFLLVATVDDPLWFRLTTCSLARAPLRPTPVARPPVRPKRKNCKNQSPPLRAKEGGADSSCRQQQHGCTGAHAPAAPRKGKGGNKSKMG